MAVRFDCRGKIYRNHLRRHLRVGLRQRVDINRLASSLNSQLEMREARSGNAVLAPAMNGGERNFGDLRDGGGSPQRVDDPVRGRVHEPYYAIVASLAQGEISDIRICDSRMPLLDGSMTLDDVRTWAKAKRGRIKELAELLGIDQFKVTKALSQTGEQRRFTVEEMDAIRHHILGEDLPQAIGRSLPVIGQVAAGNWREAIQSAIGAMPAIDPSIPRRAFVLQVAGDSMDIYVDDGANVVVDPDDKTLFNDRFYVIQNGDGEATFKQYKQNPARLVPCSSNPAHREILIGSEPFDVIGRVIWRAARM